MASWQPWRLTSGQMPPHNHYISLNLFRIFCTNSHPYRPKPAIRSLLPFNSLLFAVERISSSDENTKHVELPVLCFSKVAYTVKTHSLLLFIIQ